MWVPDASILGPGIHPELKKMVDYTKAYLVKAERFEEIQNRSLSYGSYRRNVRIEHIGDGDGPHDRLHRQPAVIPMLPAW